MKRLIKRNNITKNTAIEINNAGSPETNILPMIIRLSHNL